MITTLASTMTRDLACSAPVLAEIVFEKLILINKMVANFLFILYFLMIIE